MEATKQVRPNADRDGPATGGRVVSRAPGTPSRPLVTAALVAVGSELTTGETRDTNAGDLARMLSDEGVRVEAIVELPDDRPAIAAAFRTALRRVDLVVTTGGLGPTPDDLTREAIADAIGEEPGVDRSLEDWLRTLWRRRGIAFPESNLKQAWLVPSATALPNGHGTAPGWWVDRPDGRVIVALPGPPREMRPMWSDEVLPRLRARGLGRATVVRTLRLAGIGESAVADRIGRSLLEAPNPDVATFARVDGVDVRTIAVGRDQDEARRLADDAVAQVRAAVGDHVWAEGSTTWAEALDRALEAAGLRLATVESGTNGALVALLGAASRLGEARALPAGATTPGASTEGADLVTLSLRVAPNGTGDLETAIAIRGGGVEHTERTLAFLRDEQGRTRAAILAAWALLRALRARAAGRAGEGAG